MALGAIWADKERRAIRLKGFIAGDKDRPSGKLALWLIKILNYRYYIE